MYLLEVKNLRKKFYDLEVLKNINLSVSKKEVVSILGPSGSGKSTFLRCISMLEKPDSGSIAYLGEKSCFEKDGKMEFAPKESLKKMKNSFSLCFQNFNLFPHFNVLKNVSDAPIKVQKRDKSEAIEYAKKLLDDMGLAGKENYYPYQLSGGQQQRVAIARALAMKPDMLFFDEPTSALDPELTRGVLEVLRNLRDEHMTMIIVTHEIEFARQISDRVVFMDGGVVVEEGSPDQVILHPSEERTKAFLNKMLK